MSDPLKADGLNSLSMRRMVYLVAAALIGFLVRAEYIAFHYESLTSDDVVCSREIQFKTPPPNEKGISEFSPYTSEQIGSRFWIFQFFFLLAHRNIYFLPYFACLVNVFLYLLWAYILVHRTGRWVAGIPLMAFLALPPPWINCLGTTIGQARSCYLFGPLLILFAGSWFKNNFFVFSFGFFTIWACLEDPFSLFFLLPVLWFEVDSWKKHSGEKNWIRIPLITIGAGLAIALFPRRIPWMVLYRNGYVHPGLGSCDQIQKHASLIWWAWPQYWFGRIPWGYLQNSALGRFLDPVSKPGWDGLLHVIFWFLLAITFAMVLKSTFDKNEVKETFLFCLPPVFFLAFFVFGNQAWDALTLRYLGFWQFFIPILLGLAAARAGTKIKKRFWVLVLSLWIGINTFFLAVRFTESPRPNPGQYLAVKLEQTGYQAGFCNYWASELIRYYSKDKVLMSSYDAAPISQRAFAAAQMSRKIALVWIQGLDHPDRLPEVERQIISLGYRPFQRIDFTGEGWSILGWEKQASKPSKGRL